MPVRTVSNRGGNIVGKFPSIKMRRMIAFESLLERDFIYLLDYDTDVEWFEEQPLTIEYQYQGKTLHYTPDFRLLESERHVLVECKPECFIDTDDNRRKFAVARGWCGEHGWEFRIVTDRQVRTGFRLQNVKMLTRYARQVVNPIVRGRIYALLRNVQSPMTIQDVASALAPDDPTAVVGSILHLAFHHELCIPIEGALLSEEAPVSLHKHTPKEVRA
jgi:hypothetical protein